jgi:hypothetical protein
VPLDLDDLSGVIADAISAATAPLFARITVLEAKGFPAAVIGEKGEPGQPGKDAEPVDIDAIARQAAALIPVPKDGKDAESVDVDALVTKVAALIPVPSDGPAGKDAEPVDLEALAKQAAALVPVPRDGKDAEPVDLDVLALKAAELIPVPNDGRDGLSVTVDDVAPLVTEAVQKAVEALPKAKDGEPGASIEPWVVEALVKDAVAKIPRPENGKDGLSVTVEDVAPLIAGEVEKAVKALPVPKDGVGVTGALINKDNRLVLTLSDGTLRELGLVVGRDGEKGEKGDPGIAINGKDGLDGTLENVQPVFDGKRTISFCFKDTGEPIEGWVVKLVGMTRYEGVYSAERAYETGDQVTYSSGQWTAKADSQGKQPGTNEGAPFWQLSTKPGQPGKVGPPGPKGEKGDKGLDLRQSDMRVLR